LDLSESAIVPNFDEINHGPAMSFAGERNRYCSNDFGGKLRRTSKAMRRQGLEPCPPD
jgi:hypothetical protein